jgi:hypothetical protein
MQESMTISQQWATEIMPQIQKELEKQLRAFNSQVAVESYTISKMR